MTGRFIGRTITTADIVLCGGTLWNTGASISVCGKDNSDYPGVFVLDAHDGNRFSRLRGTPDGSLTWRNKNIDVIEEQGNGYIRYTNGIQICWGSISWTSSCSRQWGSLYETSGKNASYAKSFTELPSVSAYGCVGGKGAMVECTEGTSATTPAFYLTRGASVTEESNCFVRYIAIGKWK